MSASAVTSAPAINTASVLKGGLVAGVVLNLVSMLDNMVVLANRMVSLAQMGRILREPRLPFLPLWFAVMFGVGIGLVWLYAAARARLGPGPATAIKVGLVVGLIAGIPGNLAQASWSPVGRFLPLAWTCETIVGSVLGTLAGAWLYREKA